MTPIDRRGSSAFHAISSDRAELDRQRPSCRGLIEDCADEQIVRWVDAMEDHVSLKPDAHGLRRV